MTKREYKYLSAQKNSYKRFLRKKVKTISKAYDVNYRELTKKNIFIK